jgi:hypothetical protein
MTDPIAKLATWLAGHVEWMRHRQEADEFLSAVDACLRVVRGLARGPSEQKYLGPCGAEPVTEHVCCDLHNAHCEPPGELCCHECTEAAHPDHPRGASCVLTPCDGDVYAYRGASTGRCRNDDCKAVHSVADRQAWLDAEVRAHAFRDREIADALNISVKTIRSWATARPESRNAAGKVTRSAAPARLIAHAYDRDGKPLYLMGAVADLAEVEALRRHDRHQKRVDA